MSRVSQSVKAKNDREESPQGWELVDEPAPRPSTSDDSSDGLAVSRPHSASSSLLDVRKLNTEIAFTASKFVLDCFIRDLVQQSSRAHISGHVSTTQTAMWSLITKHVIFLAFGRTWEDTSTQTGRNQLPTTFREGTEVMNRALCPPEDRDTGDILSQIGYDDNLRALQEHLSKESWVRPVFTLSACDNERKLAASLVDFVELGTRLARELGALKSGPPFFDLAGFVTQK